MKYLATYLRIRKGTNLNSAAIGLLCLWLGACQSKTEVIIAPQDLILQVNGLDGNPQPNAKVALFDNETTFYTQNRTFGTSGAVRIGVTDQEGLIKFDSLRSDINYYVLAYTIDSAKFASQGYRIYNDNSRTGFEFLQKLNKSSTTYASIDLLPSEALVSFYADNFNDQAIPISIFVGSNSVGSVNLTTNTPSANIPINPASNPIQNGVITTKIRLGTNPDPARFVNSFDCNNITRLNVVPGGFTPVNVNRCDAGIVAFWTVQENIDKLPIAITLNSDNVLDSLKTVSRIAPTSFKSPFTLSRNLESGDYTYFATAKGCLWPGRFTITKNQTTFIELPRCETGN